MIEHLLRFVAIGSFIVGAAAIYITIRNNTLQLGAQVFLAYSERVRALRNSALLDTGDPEAVRAAMFLIFEFYELKRRGYVSGAIWSIWDTDIADLLRTAIFRSQWQTTRERFKNHPHFLHWVDSQQR